ncbi:NAD-dependent epimerase/dehydratase family protein [Saprospiraceae bacterium]|nr:NAD-dependent epimerase/dehydratase family protein [Saprospiraceae bacterium]
MNPKILVTGSGGQIGTVLVEALRSKYGQDQVVASDLKESKAKGLFVKLDITDQEALEKVIKEYEITQIYHLAALLSSKGEDNIHLTWNINLLSYLKILEIAKSHGIKKIFFPSTIGIYGNSTPKQLTPQYSSFEPETMYGITKYTGELWNAYYNRKYDMDIRSIRYPGVISYQSRPHGGTTDYAVDIFFEAKEKEHYVCYLKPDTALPMIYMPDLIDGTLQLMEAPKSDLNVKVSYNLSGFSLTPDILYQEIKKHIPNFKIEYKPDHRQQIAESWTESIDDSHACKDWNWQPRFDIKSMTEDMLINIPETKRNKSS